MKTVKYIDLFCGIGGFRVAMNNVASELKMNTECVFSSDIDLDAQSTYAANFGETPMGDITLVDEKAIPQHDLLLGGFPCQAFSIIGDMKGFKDARGTLFFDIARIINEKKPKALVLENVKQLRGHDSGNTLRTILNILDDLGYWVDYKIYNALDFGLPQKRERIIIVGFLDGIERNFEWPKPGVLERKTLEQILELDEDVDRTYFASKKIQQKRKEMTAGKKIPPGRTIWHENKSGNVSTLPYSCALRAGASYNYLLVDGIRRLTMREMLRLQGFPESFKVVCGYSATRKQLGNSVPVPMIQSVLKNAITALSSTKNSKKSAPQSKAVRSLF